MREEGAFLQAISESPDDDALRLVYADWLEERGDGRAGAVRRRPEVSPFLSVLRTGGSAAALRMVETWVFEGKGDLVRDLAVILNCRPGGPRTSIPLPGVAPSTIQSVQQALAPLPDAAGAAAVIRRLGPSAPPPDQAAELASRLAFEHGPEVLLAVLERYEEAAPFLELLACLVQEMVIRGVILADVPVARRLFTRLRAQGHPLARLPLSLTSVEGDLRPWLPHYQGEGIGWSTPLHPGGPRSSELLPTESLTAFTCTDRTDPASAGRISQAVRHWQEHSNGQVEAKVFQAEAPIGKEGLSVRLFWSLGLACVQGAEQAALHAWCVTPRDAFALLFSAASTGGAYTRGLHGAYGREAAWQSLAGLAGATGDDITETAALAPRCLWVTFHAESEWFYQVAWDIGLLTVRPDGNSLAVLAASDTD